MLYWVDWKFKPLLFLIDFIGYTVFFPFSFFRRQIAPARIKKILVIRLDNIGDILVTTPALRALRKRFPNAKIDVLVRPQLKELLQGNLNINKILCLDIPWLHKGGAVNLLDSIKFFFGNHPTIKQLKQERYDLAIEFHTDPRNIFLLWKINATHRIGHAVRGLGFLLTKIVPFAYDTHIIDRHLSIPYALGAEKESQTLDLAIPAKVTQKVKELLVKTNVVSDFVCLNPGTGRVNKFWVNEYWALLADKLIEKYDLQVVFTGGKEDTKDFDEIFKNVKCREKVVSFVGKTSLMECAAVIKQSKLCISTDSGPMHLAKAVGTPVIGLFGPIPPEQWGYKDETSDYVVKKIECSFCDKPDCIRTVDRYLCMRLITVNDVLKKAERFLQ